MKSLKSLKIFKGPRGKWLEEFEGFEVFRGLGGKWFEEFEEFEVFAADPLYTVMHRSSWLPSSLSR